MAQDGSRECSHNSLGCPDFQWRKITFTSSPVACSRFVFLCASCLSTYFTLLAHFMVLKVLEQLYPDCFFAGSFVMYSEPWDYESDIRSTISLTIVGPSYHWECCNPEETDMEELF
eukprot:3067481-Amphidinium_carterae.1